MKINWKVRVKNKLFWLAFIPAVLTRIRAVAALFGYQLETEVIGAQLTTIVEALFAVVRFGAVTEHAVGFRQLQGRLSVHLHLA